MAQKRRTPPTFYFLKRKNFTEKLYVELYRVNGRHVLMFRDRKTGRFVKRQPIYRFSAIMRSIPIHRQYYASIAQAFGAEDTLKDAERDIEIKLIEFTEGSVGYSEDLWWFKGTIESELEEYPTPEEEVKEIFENINRIVLRWEDELGFTLEWEEDYIFVP